MYCFVTLLEHGHEITLCQVHAWPEVVAFVAKQPCWTRYMEFGQGDGMATFGMALVSLLLLAVCLQATAQADCGVGKTLPIVSALEFFCRRWEERSVQAAQVQHAADGSSVQLQPAVVLLASHTLQQQQQLFDNLRPLLLGLKVRVLALSSRNDSCFVPKVKNAASHLQVSVCRGYGLPSALS